ncbi:hypothetical protein HK101_000506 [Irineochytrium annulatum]|nr:hypothetical protein HK101_000506 [Irineochytrium annulatum]
MPVAADDEDDYVEDADKTLVEPEDDDDMSEMIQMLSKLDVECDAKIAKLNDRVSTVKAFLEKLNDDSVREFEAVAKKSEQQIVEQGILLFSENLSRDAVDMITKFKKSQLKDMDALIASVLEFEKNFRDEHEHAMEFFVALEEER